MVKKKVDDSFEGESRKGNCSNILIFLENLNVNVDGITLGDLTQSKIHGEAVIELNKLKHRGILND